MDRKMRDKDLTEAMGECHHLFIAKVGEEYSSRDNCSFRACDWEVVCQKCGLSYRDGDEDGLESARKAAARFVEHANTVGRQNDTFYYNDFSSPAGFFKLWGWAKEQRWWHEFLMKTEYQEHDEIEGGLAWNPLYFLDYIDPDRFADAIYSHLHDTAGQPLLTGRRNGPNRVSDQQVVAWAQRHSLQGSLSELRTIFEDAASLKAE